MFTPHKLTLLMHFLVAHKICVKLSIAILLRYPVDISDKYWAITKTDNCNFLIGYYNT